MSPTTPPPLALGRLVDTHLGVKKLSRGQASTAGPTPSAAGLSAWNHRDLPLGRYLLLACGTAAVLLAVVIYLVLHAGAATGEDATKPADGLVAERTKDPVAEVPAATPAPHAPPAPVAAATPVAEVASEPEGETSPLEEEVAPPAVSPTPGSVAAVPARIEARDPPRVLDCSKLGTRIVFYNDPPDAFAKAKEANKLVFFVHLSGNFEDDAFT